MSTISSILPTPPDNFSTQISTASVSATELTIGLDTTARLGTEGVGQLFKKDSNGNIIAGSIEFIHWTNISGNNLVLTDTGDRGITGSDNGAQTYVADDYFEVWVSSYYNLDSTDVVSPSGTQTLTNKTLTSPKVGTAVLDTNGNEIIKTPATTSAVNEVTITNAATGNAPVISATGDDAAIPLGLTGKSAFVKATGLYDAGNTGTGITIDWSKGDRQKCTLTGNCTFNFSNAVAGQTLTLYAYQDGTGSRTIAFTPTITYADNTTPTWTTTAGKLNILVIFYDGSAYYGVANKFA